MIWDLNEFFGRFSLTGSGNLNNTTAKQQMSHLLHENDADFPLIRELLSIPMYERMYLAHFKTILLENFDNDAYYDTGLSLQTLIDADVQADNNKFFIYNNFTSNLTSDVTGGGRPSGGATPGITDLMDGRNTHLLGLGDFTQTEPTISNITLSNPSPIITETVSITALIADGNAAYLGHRDELGAPFNRVQMFDDGAHDDGAANDGVSIVINNSFTQYYIYAENDNIGKFSPQRAEHEYHTITATTSNPTVGDLVINEFMASNDATTADQDGEFDDWIELYNNSTSTIDLEGYFLTDDASDLMKWAFPSGAFIDGNGYLIIWADSDEDQDGLHAGFKLSASAESVLLVDASGTIIDEVSYFDQITDISYGRFPNGIGNFQTMSPTFNAENSGITSTSDISRCCQIIDTFERGFFRLRNLKNKSVSMNMHGFFKFLRRKNTYSQKCRLFNTTYLASETVVLKAYPNPADNSFYLEIEEQEQKERLVSIHNLNGSLFYQDIVSQNAWIDASDWASGLYIIRTENSFLRVVID